MNPRGALVAIGGAEDKEEEMTILRRLLHEVRGEARTVEIIPTASRVPDEVSEPYLKAFRELGLSDVGILDIRDRRDGENDKLLRRIDAADILYFTGGDQLRLTSTLGGTTALEAIRERYERGAVLAGTSAGAAALSSTMIFEGDARDSSMHKGNVQMTPGLGFITSAVIDTHFIDRGRFSRLLEVIASNPGFVGLGLGENTGVIVRAGEEIEVVGEGLAVVMDGQELKHTNVADIRNGEPISVEGMLVHTLGHGYRYSLATKTYKPRARASRRVAA